MKHPDSIEEIPVWLQRQNEDLLASQVREAVPQCAAEIGYHVWPNGQRRCACGICVITSYSDEWRFLSVRIGSQQ